MIATAIGRVAAAFALAVVAGGCGSADRQPVALGSRDWAIDARDASCDFRSADLTMLQFHGSSRRETSCLNAEIAGLSVDSFRMAGPSGPYRLFVSYDPRSAGKGRIAIYLPGGPRALPLDFIGQTFAASVPAALARQGYTVLAPEHLGTLTRSVYPASDLRPAAAEIAALVDRSVAATGARTKVVLVAASADAIIGMEVAERIRTPLMLLSALVPRLRGLAADPAGTDLAPDAGAYVRTFSRISGDNERAIVKARDEDQARAFAGDRFDMDLQTQVDAAPDAARRCLLLVFGAADRRIKLPTLRQPSLQLPPDRIVVVPAMGHGPTTEAEADAVARIVDRFAVAAPCRPDKAVGARTAKRGM